MESSWRLPASPLARPRFAMIEDLSQGSLIIAVSSNRQRVRSNAVQIPYRHQVTSSSRSIQFPVATGLDRRGKLYQRGFLEMATDHHQTYRQTVDTSAWHGEGRISGHVERTGIGLHVERRVNQGSEWRIGRRYKR